MTDRFTRRVVAVAFGTELLFALLIPIAYLRLFDVRAASERQYVLAIVGAVYLVRTVFLVGLLTFMMRPIVRWRRAVERGAQAEALLLRSAGRAAYQLPQRFSILWSVVWAITYLPVTAAVEHFLPERVPLPPHAMTATLIASLAFAAASLSLGNAVLGWLLAPVAGAISLQARRRGVDLTARVLSLRVRLAVLALCLVSAPTAWMATLALVGGGRAQLSAVEEQAERSADRLATHLEVSSRGRTPSAERLRELLMGLDSPVEQPSFLADGDGNVLWGGEAARLLRESPWLRATLRRAAQAHDAGAVSHPRLRRTLAFHHVARRWIVGVVEPPVAGPSADALLTLVVCALLAVAWAPVVAGYLSGSIAGPIRRIGDVIGQISRQGDANRLERVPIYFKDSVGELTEALNQMMDRLQESSRRVRSSTAVNQRLLELNARRAAQLRAVLDNMVEGVFACDSDGRMRLTNASALQLLGLAGAAEAPRTVEELHRFHPPRHGSGAPFHDGELPLARALAGETIVAEEEVVCRRGRHEQLQLRVSAAPIRDEAGRVIGAVEVARDVTELLELDQLKDQFLRVAAHELKTPVTLMKGFALTLLRTSDGAPLVRQRRMLEAIDRGADRLKQIVENLLDTSQLFLGVLQLYPEPVELRRLIEDTIQRIAPGAPHHRIRLLPGPPVPLRGDLQRLCQVVAHLLSNAVKFSPAGGDVVLEVTPAASDSGRNQAVVAVRDPGIGIPGCKQARLFHLFYRPHTDTEHDYGGMGVGLYLAREIIVRHGGRMWFESEEGRGSTFYFSLPAP